VNAASRAKAIIFHPNAEWPRIEQESGDPAFLLTRYVVLLALVPAACGFIGACLIGVIVPGLGAVRAPVLDGLFSAVFGYVMTGVTVLVLALIIDVLAPLFGGRRDFDGAFKLAVYSFTPVWLAGIFLLLPGLRFLTLSGFYGAYILMTGLPLMMKSPARWAYLYAAVIVIFACVLILLTSTAQRILFTGAGGL
jgi:hypothetical protein